MKKIAFALFLLGLSLPTAQAKKPTRWDYLTSGTPIFGSVTVITKNGKKYKDNSVAFSPSSLTLYSRGDSIPREEVKEVVVREPRDRCCARIKLPIAPIELAILAGDGTVGTVIFLSFCRRSRLVSSPLLRQPYSLRASAISNPAGCFIKWCLNTTMFHRRLLRE